MTKLRGRTLLAAAIVWAASSIAALAQTSPNFTFGQVPTVAQWNALFAAKQDYLGATPLLTTGGTMTGKLITPASNATVAGFRMQPGIAPSSPLDGDMWVTAAGLFVRINGATVPALTSITLTGDVTGSGSSSITTVLATAQPAVHTWALAQTFTVAPVFTNQSGSRTALGLGTAATQNTGTSGTTIPFLDGTNTWANGQTFSAAMTYGGVTLSNSVTGTTSMVLAASPTFTGAPLSTTAGVDTNTTQLATTAFVLAQSAAATPLPPSGAGAVGTSTRFARGDHVHPAASAYSTLWFGSGNLNPMAQNATFFYVRQAVATESIEATPVSQAGTIDKLSCSGPAAPGGTTQTFIMTVRKNAADTLITCTQSTGGAATCVDGTNNTTVAANDKLDIKQVNSATSGSSGGMNCSLRLAVSSP